MIIFLRPGEQVEVQFIKEGSNNQPSNEAVVVKHDRDGTAKAGTVSTTERHFAQHIELPLTPQS